MLSKFHIFSLPFNLYVHPYAYTSATQYSSEFMVASFFPPVKPLAANCYRNRAFQPDQLINHIPLVSPYQLDVTLLPHCLGPFTGGLHDLFRLSHVVAKSVPPLLLSEFLIVSTVRGERPVITLKGAYPMVALIQALCVSCILIITSAHQATYQPSEHPRTYISPVS